MRREYQLLFEKRKCNPEEKYQTNPALFRQYILPVLDKIEDVDK